MQPFVRHFTAQQLITSLVVADDGSSVSLNLKEESEQRLLVHVVRQRQRFQSRLLEISFTTLSEYLCLLRQLTSGVLEGLGARAMLYLAAAASDFYIPRQQLVTHKIQSTDGPLSLSFHLVPKMLRPLVRDWCPRAFVVSS